MSLRPAARRRAPQGNEPAWRDGAQRPGCLVPALKGLTIIDMTRLLPGPAATMHFVDFGADVIKVEDTGAGDYMRTFRRPLRLTATRQSMRRSKR